MNLVVVDVDGPLRSEVRDRDVVERRIARRRVLDHAVAGAHPQPGDVRVIGAAIEMLSQLEHEVLAFADADQVGMLDGHLGLDCRTRPAPDDRHVEVAAQRGGDLHRRLHRQRGEAESDQGRIEVAQLVDQQLILALGERPVAIPDILRAARGDVRQGVIGDQIAVRLRAGDDQEIFEIDDPSLVAGPAQIAREL